MSTHPLFAALAAVLVSGCTASLASITNSSSRDLTPEEKKVISESLLDNIREPAKAKYLWAQFPANAPLNGQAHYCSAVNAKSPHAEYNGLQDYMVQVQMANGQIVASTITTMAGGSDLRIVRNLCAKRGLNPDDAV
jgi:hypothetical protein